MDKKRKLKDLRLEEKVSWLLEHVKEDDHVNQVISLNSHLKDYQEQMTHGAHSKATNIKNDLEVRVNKFIDANWKDIYPMMLEEESTNNLKYIETAIHEKNSIYEQILEKIKHQEVKENSLVEHIKNLEKKAEKLKQILKIKASLILLFFLLPGIFFFIIGYTTHKFTQTKHILPIIDDSTISISSHKHIIDSISFNYKKDMHIIKNHIIDSMELVHRKNAPGGPPPPPKKPIITVFIAKTPGSASDTDKEKLLKQEIEYVLQKKFELDMQPYEKSPNLKVIYSITKVTPQELKYEIYIKDGSALKLKFFADLAPFETAKKELISSLNEFEMKIK